MDIVHEGALLYGAPCMEALKRVALKISIEIAAAQISPCAPVVSERHPTAIIPQWSNPSKQ
jgi:hypothetical protein